jgi:GH15 family glucan-1,4-alpha-glucosidase
MPAMTYGAFPYSMPATAIPVAYAMPNYPVPVHTETASTSSPKPKTDRVWVGRTKKQVDEDNAKIAHKEGVYKPNEMVPKAASPDQLFWVIEPDDSNTLRTFRTIEDDLQPGKWKVDPRYGNAYFVREKEKAKK